MFIHFFYHLRAMGLKVSVHEWQTLLRALERGHAAESLNRFYYLARAVCCRTEGDYDLFDRGFSSFFEELDLARDEPQAPHARLPPEFFKGLEEWLKNPVPPRSLTDQEKAQLEALKLDDLRSRLADRLKEQKSRHDGGNKWVGTGGTSPFGHGGTNPAGIRVGGEGTSRSAVQIASERAFKNFRHDIILDTRQMGMALRKLRHWVRDGHAEELDLDETIAATSKQGGDITLVFRPERKNQLKLLLLMDVGGSMTYHSQVCEQLFSAAHQSTHFKEFRHFFFHNCPYDDLYLDVEQNTKRPTLDILREFDRSWLVLIVGDAAMAPYELTEPGGAIDFFHHNSDTGLQWLTRLRQHFPAAVWLNPEPQQFWGRPSNRLVRTVFSDMFPMSLEGLDQAMSTLKKLKESHP